MKRSRSLVFTTVMATAGVSLVACDTQGPGILPAPTNDQVEAWSYRSLEACQAANEIPDAACADGLKAAQTDEAAAAPKFADAKTCEEQHGEGQCVPRSQAGGGSIWGPLITGFVVGRMLDGGFRGTGMYRDRDGGYATGWGGGRLNTDYATGRSRVSANSIDPPDAVRSAPAKVQTRTSVVSRGGFGGRMSERSYSSSRWGG